MFMPKFPNILFLAVLLGLFSGCSWFSSDDEEEPMELEDIEATIKVKKHWSRGVGSQGDEELYLRLSPALDGGFIYAANVKGDIYAFNQETGKKLWDVDLDESVNSAVGAGEDTVVVATVNGELVALDQDDGEELWRTKLSSEMLAAAQVGAGVVVAQSIDGTVLGIDKNNGGILWRYKASLPSLTLRGSATPVIAGGICYLGFSNGKVVALDVHTGLLVWEQQVSIAEGRTELERLIDFDGQPLIVGSDLYIAGYQGSAAAMDKNQGRGLWIEEVSTTSPLAHGDGNLYVSEADGRVLAFRMSSGRRVWQNENLLLRQLSGPAVVSGYVAVADFEGYIHFMDTKEGKFVGRYKVGGKGVRNALMSNGDTLFVLTNKGGLFALYVEEK